MLPLELIDKINSARCFALIGSGPSSEMGYPSWRSLAEGTIRVLSERQAVEDPEPYQKYLARSAYSELFTLAQKEAGGRSQLVAIISQLIRDAKLGPGRLYEYLVKWPFACYLTTNYDDEISRRLEANHEHYTVLQNRKEDLFAIRDSVSRLVVKLHSDLQHPDDLVLTSTDYTRLEVSPEGSYFREKLRAIFDMFSVLIIGHSLADEDISLVLKTAKNSASPAHPVFMTLCDVTTAERREYSRKYNIQIIPYSNSDGQHSELLRHFRTADKFISPRTSFAQRLPTPASDSEIEAATSLLVFRRLQKLQRQSRGGPFEMFGPPILAALAGLSSGGSAAEVAVTPPVSMLTASPAASEAIDQALQELVHYKLAWFSDGRYMITDAGRTRVGEVRADRELDDHQAFGEFKTALVAECGLSDSELERAEATLRLAIVAVYRERGISMASSIFSDRSLLSSDLTSVFRMLSTAAAALPEGEYRATFLRVARDFLIDPTDAQKRYLESISQGFFLYHMAGLDPTCTRVRRELFQETAWFLDSSVMLPWIAKGSHSYGYANDLFERLNSLASTLITTDKLLAETWEHLEWAVRQVKNGSVDSLQFMDAALLRDEFRQNLFIDGYIRLSATGEVGTFADYLELVCPGGLSRRHLDAEIVRRGVRVVEFENIRGFKPEHLGELPELQAALRRERELKGTFRHEQQVAAEAEVLHIISRLRDGSYSLDSQAGLAPRAYFASQSRVLDRVRGGQDITTWTPEALYRYVTSLPGERSDPDLLQQCMLHEFYFSGVSFIDRPRYLEFFGPAIRESKASFRDERAAYLRDVEPGSAIDDAFDRTPDLLKPFFTSQMSLRIAAAATKRAEVEAKRAQAAEDKVRSLEAERQTAWSRKAKQRLRHELGRARNTLDPRHLRKRERQAKKRRNKRKKK